MLPAVDEDVVQTKKGCRVSRAGLAGVGPHQTLLYAAGAGCTIPAVTRTVSEADGLADQDHGCPAVKELTAVDQDLRNSAALPVGPIAQGFDGVEAASHSRWPEGLTKVLILDG